MRSEEVIEILRRHKPELAAEFGVRSLRLFGSIARDEARAGSDVDIIADFDRPTGYFGLVRLQLYLEGLLGRPVDLGTEGALRPAMRSRLTREAVRVG